MKTAIIYYSMLGNTDYAAGKIAEELRKSGEVDLVRIEPEEAYPDKGAKKFLWGGKSALMGEKPALKPYTLDLDQVDRVIIGTPVWASTFTPPIRTLVDENPGLANKTVGIFTCLSGSGANKTIAKLKAYLGIETLPAELILFDPKDRPKPENDEKIAAFCAALA